MERKEYERRFEMTKAKRMEIIKRFLERRCFPLLERKGKASTCGTDDPNKGFDEVAEPLAEVMADFVNYGLLAVSMMIQDGLIDLDEPPKLMEKREGKPCPHVPAIKECVRHDDDRECVSCGLEGQTAKNERKLNADKLVKQLENPSNDGDTPLLKGNCQVKD